MDKQFEASTIEELEATLMRVAAEAARLERLTAEAEANYWKLGAEAAKARSYRNQLMWRIMTRKVELEYLKGQMGSPESLT